MRISVRIDKRGKRSMELSVNLYEKEYDIIIAGGGPAGCAAAIAAARQGADVLLLEAGYCLGGMATAGLVSKWAPLTDKEKVIYRSVSLEIIKRYKKAANQPEDKWDWITIEPEALKRVYDDMLLEAGASVLFGTTVCDAVCENGVVKSVIALTKSGLTEFCAKQFIDCTGDADLAVKCGVPFEKGDPDDGTLQPSSLCFEISNIDKSKVDIPIGSNSKDGLWATMMAEKKFPLLRKHFIPAWINDSTLIANAGHLFDVDNTDPKSVSAAMIRGRKIAEQYLQAPKYYLPDAFLNATVCVTAPALGVRESRRIISDYVFTVEDYAERRSFPDEIGRNCYWLDCHGKKSVDKVYGRYGPGESHGIPFSCLLPKNTKNLLVAGRCAGFTRQALATMRVMPNCLCMGEAAGIAAALAVKSDVQIREVAIKEIQNKII